MSLLSIGQDRRSSYQSRTHSTQPTLEVQIVTRYTRQMRIPYVEKKLGSMRVWHMGGSRTYQVNGQCTKGRICELTSDMSSIDLEIASILSSNLPTDW